MTAEAGPCPRGALALGGSWGGLEVASRILEVMPASLPAAVFLVLHQRPALDSRLVDILTRRSALQVISPVDKTPVEAGHIYVAPPGYHMLINPEGSIGLAVYGHVHYSRPSIDETFFSVGHVFGAESVGALLTGANEDGAGGLGYIARRGGLAVAQNPRQAEAPMMPEAAIATGLVDEVVDTDGLGTFLRNAMVGMKEQ